ncbi:UNVERIFIED_CONTAM: LacI family DNA-binding transcriptional regulator [Streptococcus canis]|uniref:LacI family DNA-binding transcriptional regulator n=1 Tax=Streptococcus canis TaxID=1329 RepID=UPI0013D9680A|nr:LacI family DNA-binding transcriptional regulator [Streptococcus canis]QKG76039.1 LacI family DNA-binding transcriptional regulator [Streptococcus canis]GMX36735.1 LacI family DNA-binding transcriptional regulator [Streptococcus canis]GMX40706.1 LacI family DNA-binding transcriptional regulator [Streptococcus canis]
MTSIRDIAKLAGVAPSTVSRYLNQSDYVSQETSQIIAAVIQQLDYSPNMTARQLSTGKTNRIGVIIPHTKHPYFIDIFRGLMEAALESQYQLLFLPSDYDQEIERDYLEQLKGKAFDSLIFTSRKIPLRLVERYADYGQIVLLEHCTSKKISSVSIDRHQGLEELFQWLAGYNVGKCALLFSRNKATSSTFKATLSAFKANLGNQHPYESFGQVSTYEEAYQLAATLSQDTSFDAIVANGDDVAAGILTYYQEHQLQPPLVVSQDKQLSGQLLHLPSIDNNRFQLGKHAFSLATGTRVAHLTLPSQFFKNR